MIGPDRVNEERRCQCCGALVITDENDPDYSEANAPYYIMADGSVLCSFKCFKWMRDRAQEDAKASGCSLQFGKW
jgi:hypothetical protein